MTRPMARTTARPASGDPELETIFQALRPGEAEGARTLPRHLRGLQALRSAAERRPLLFEAVQMHALPRLLAAHRAEAGPAASRVRPEDVDNLLNQIVAPDLHLAEAAVSILALRGAGRDDIVLNLLGPVAERLHEQWRRDELTFADVALSVGRLQRLLRSPVLPEAPLHYGPPGGSVLVAAAPGDAGAFGAAVFEDFFRNAGWEAERIAPKSDDALAALVAKARIDVLVVAAGRDAGAPAAARLIRRLRREASEADLVVILGGAAVAARPDVWRRAGADAMAKDAPAAVLAANRLLRSRVA